MASKIINTLIILTGPILMALSQVWQIFIPAGLEEGLISFFNLLLILFGGAVTLFKGVPALFRLNTKNLRQSIQSRL